MKERPMEKTTYSNEPVRLERMGDGRWIYRWAVEQTDTGWICYEVTLAATPTADSVKTAAVVALWPVDAEAKLINDYNAACNNLLPERYKTAYADFIAAKAALKADIDAFFAAKEAAEAWRIPSAEQIAAKEAAAAAEAAELAACAEYPTPESVVPMVNANGDQIGTARILVDSETMEPICVVNSASPRRAWAIQKAEHSSKKTDRAAKVAQAKAAKQSGQLQRRIAALEAMLGVE